MVANKEIYIAGRRIGLGTSVKGSVEVNRSTTQTFDGPKGAGVKDVSHTLEIGKLSCDTFEDYKELSKLMIEMRSNPETITVSETFVSPEAGNFTVYKHYINCLVDGDEYEMSAEDLTASTLKFASEGMNEEYSEN
ncbi:hypothetical protein [Methanobrevibacter woesei]|uniref:hypothetical protein n=1 Tax=Methanobrevibacter woesei TaxID=190976 RepID=UPI0024B7735A|nr:hypothetical protein [Methanobrevibacter woesei]